MSYEVITLPPQVKHGLRAVAAQLGLVYGAFDLSVSRTGTTEEFSFLEINPSGQYGFLEAAAGVPITDSMVDYLSGTTAGPETGAVA